MRKQDQFFIISVMGPYAGESENSIFNRKMNEIEENSYNLALVDLRMPKMDGIGVLENIKKRKPEIPVIIYTGYGSVTTAVEAMRKGASDYLNKPFSPEELKLAIEKVLEQKGNTPQPS